MKLERGETIEIGNLRDYAVTLASGEVCGTPYNAMGVGTYIEVPAQDWVTICGVTFRRDSLEVTEQGFEFGADTEFMD